MGHGVSHIIAGNYICFLISGHYIGEASHRYPSASRPISMIADMIAPMIQLLDRKAATARISKARYITPIPRIKPIIISPIYLIPL